MSESELNELYKKNFYPSIAKFYQICKNNGVKRTYKQLREFIDNQTVEQLHKVTVPRDRFITASDINEGYQMDLVDYSKFNRTNNGIKWLLVIIDIFSRYVFIEPIKNKQAIETSVAFKKVLDSGNKPQYIYHDMGNEFKGAFLKLIKDNGIMDITNRADYHKPLGVVDRFCRTLKNIISKVQTERGNTKYIDKLQDIVKYYNNTKHRTLGHTPKEIYDGLFNDEIKLMNSKKLNYNNQIKNKNIINIGDTVRIKTDKKNFGKSFDWNYLPETHKIIAINDKISKLDNNVEYYNRDLLKVPDSSVSLKETISDEKTDRRVARELRRLN